MDRAEVLKALNIISKAKYKTKVTDWVIESYTDFPDVLYIVFVGDCLEGKIIKKFIDDGFMVDICEWYMEVC